jgi:hypothetical protein
MVSERAARERIKPTDVRFTRKDIRDATQWSDNQLKVHCARLADMEFLLVHGGNRGHSLRYELLWDGGDDAERARHLCGLIDTTALHDDPLLRPAQVGVSAAQVGAKLAPSCPQVGVKLGLSNRPQTRTNAGDAAGEVINGHKPHISSAGTSSLAAVVPVAH